MNSPERVNAATVLGWLRTPDAVTVIDVQAPAEFEAAQIAGSYNVSLNLLDEHAAQLAAGLDREVVLVCQSGGCSAQAGLRLAGVGADRWHVLAGGVAAYAAAGGEVVRGQDRWAMERQVRLVAGVPVLAGTAASPCLPAARLLAGGVGAGLTLSALTDACTRVVSTLPCNRAPGTRTAAGVLGELPPARTAA